MLYYKVIKGDLYDRKTGYTTIENELVTESEKAKKFPSIPENAFSDAVNVSSKNTYFCFGARFAARSAVYCEQKNNKSDIILDRRILKAFERKYGLSFDETYKYCVFGQYSVLTMEYKGETYKLQYFDGCFYPYLVRI